MKDSDSEIIEKLGTNTFPSVIILTPDGQTVVYDGKFLGTSLSVHHQSSPHALLKACCSPRVIHMAHALICAGKFKIKELSKFLSKHAAEAPAKDADNAQSRDNSDADTDDEGDNGQDKVVPQVR